MTSRALAFMANDRYLHWAKAFLESVRSKDANLPLYCIPHVGPIEALCNLRSVYRFEFFAEGTERLDAFGKRLYPFARGRHRANLRKYVALNLPVDEIAYFDIDMVMLVDPERFFGHVEAGRADFVYFSESPEWVYRAGRLHAARELFPEMRLISAGAFVTSPRRLSIDDIIGTVENNFALFRSLRHLNVYDQPVLNFVLHSLAKRIRHITELDPALCGMVSSGNPDLRWVEGKIVNVKLAGEVLAVHWAGPAKRHIKQLAPGGWPMQRFLEALHLQADERIRSLRQ
nr:hypothetical protein Hi04_10k_c1074_00007 [uncultured bacterium]